MGIRDTLESFGGALIKDPVLIVIIILFIAKLAGVF